MSVATRVAARGAILSLPAALFVIYWRWQIFPTVADRLLDSFIHMLFLVPPAAGSALAIWWGYTRYKHGPLPSMLTGMTVGTLCFLIEGIAVRLVSPAVASTPFVAADWLPGLVVGVLAGYARVGVDGQAV